MRDRPPRRSHGRSVLRCHRSLRCAARYSGRATGRPTLPTRGRRRHSKWWRWPTSRGKSRTGSSAAAGSTSDNRSVSSAAVPRQPRASETRSQRPDTVPASPSRPSNRLVRTATCKRSSVPTKLAFSPRICAASTHSRPISRVCCQQCADTLYASPSIVAVARRSSRHNSPGSVSNAPSAIAMSQRFESWRADTAIAPRSSPKLQPSVAVDRVEGAACIEVDLIDAQLAARPRSRSRCACARNVRRSRPASTRRSRNDHSR